jgi:SAM-dependent methyltransferase
LGELELLSALHAGGQRQGPGGDQETQRAWDLTGLEAHPDLAIADIGCGTGASTLVLARLSGAPVLAVDFLHPFTFQLTRRAAAAGLGEQVRAITATMQALPFAEASLDLIWSEGAIYNMGFEAGLAAWRRLLRPAGVVAVSEITWLTEVRPAELEDYWLREYPAIATASDKVTQLETLGFELLGYFALPPSCWLEGYYRPLEQRFAAFLEAQAHSAAAQDIVAAERREIALYERYADHYSYGFYIARRSD